METKFQITVKIICMVAVAVTDKCDRSEKYNILQNRLFWWQLKNNLNSCEK